MIVCFFGAYDKNFTSNKLILQGLKENNIEVIEVNSHVKVSRMDSKKDMNTLTLIKRVLKKYKIVSETFSKWKDIKKSDVIYVGYPGHFDVLLAYIVAKVLGKKMIFNPLIIFYTGFVEEQGILDKNSLLAKILKFAETVIYRLPDIVTPDTPFQKDHLHQEFFVPEEKLKVLPIGADNHTYIYAKKDPVSTTFTVVYYGLYAPVHGAPLIMEAAKLCENDPAIKFIMVGNGQDYEKTYNLAKRLQLHNVFFHRDMTEENALHTLQQADIFLGFLAAHPAIKRAIPNKVYQGLALGKTVVTADSPAITSLLEHGKTVYTIKPGSSKDLAKAIQTLKDNRALQVEIAQNGYDLYKTSLTPKRIAERLIVICRQLIDEKPVVALEKHLKKAKHVGKTV